MLSRSFVRGMLAVLAALLLGGTAWSDPGADPSRPERLPLSAETILVPGPEPFRTIIDNRSELLREWATRRDKRAPSGAHTMDAVLLGIVPWALLAFRELISTRRARLSLGGTPRTVGARSPPLQPA